MSANSVQWLLKSGIKSADFPDLYHAIEELQCRHPTFETIVERVHKSTFVLSAKKSVIERKECDVNHERFIDVELNMGQKKDKIELNMAGDAPADEFLALISIKDLNGPQFRVFLFNEDSPSYLEPFYGSKCMIHVWVLPFNFNELCQHLKSAQQIITENERSSMMLMVCTLDATFTGNSLLLDKTRGLGHLACTIGKHISAYANHGFTFGTLSNYKIRIYDCFDVRILNCLDFSDDFLDDLHSAFVQSVQRVGNFCWPETQTASDEIPIESTEAEKFNLDSSGQGRILQALGHVRKMPSPDMKIGPVRSGPEFAVKDNSDNEPALFETMLTCLKYSSANSVQWILKSGIKSADFPDLYHAIEELQCRHPAFETIVERVHKSTFVLSAKKSVIERKECDVNHERFIDVELNMGQKKDKIELNMAGDAPADAFLALISVKDLNGPQFRVFLFNEESPSHLEPFYGSKCMIHVWVLPFGFNELCQHLKSAQQIITENERSSMVSELVECRFDTGNTLQDKNHGREPRSIQLSLCNIICLHEQFTFKIASWRLFLSNRIYAYAFFVVCLVYMFCRIWQLVDWIQHLIVGSGTSAMKDIYKNGLLTTFIYLRLASSCAIVYNCFVEAKIQLYLYSTAVEIWLVPLENTYLLMKVMSSQWKLHQSESLIILISAFSIVWTILMIAWIVYTVPLCKAYSELATFVGRKHKLQAMKSRSNRLKRKNA
ncbi:hypothetical protein Ddc_12339 [Ditylenchus destructor]|nr:hypothetical protein Ddc_12339 [Ditylenchus destructor]